MKNSAEVEGYKIIEGESDYLHRFGGETALPVLCPTCHGNVHLIIELDMADSALNRLKTTSKFVPLVGCLNCSGNWATQTYRIVEGQVVDYMQTVDEKWIMEEEDQLLYPLPKTPVQLVPLEKEEVLKEENSDDAIDYVFDQLGTAYICRLFGGELTDGGCEPVCCTLCSQEAEYIASIAGDSTEREVVTGVEFFFGEMIFNFYFCSHCQLMKIEPLQT